MWASSVIEAYLTSLIPHFYTVSRRLFQSPESNNLKGGKNNDKVVNHRLWGRSTSSNWCAHKRLASGSEYQYTALLFGSVCLLIRRILPSTKVSPSI